jgi:hypothetical protein
MSDEHPTDDAAVAHLSADVADRGMTLDPSRLNTPGQLAFAVPVRGLTTWRATIKRDGKRVAHGDGVTRSAAIRDALNKL